jgi:hypothetical protein
MLLSYLICSAKNNYYLAKAAICSCAIWALSNVFDKILSAGPGSRKGQPFDPFVK